MADGHTEVKLMLPTHIVEFVTEQSKKHDISRTEEITEALNDYRFLQEARDLGAQILIQNPDGTTVGMASRH